MSSTSSRKKSHIDLCLDEEVRHRVKRSGLERYELLHNALPEIDLDEVDTRIEFLGRTLTMPLIINSMTGGYEEAERINRELAETCEAEGLALGLGSQRQALESTTHHESWRAARKAAPSIPIFGNIGAPEIARGVSTDAIVRLVDMIEADGFAIHLNPLQELMQPEGTPRFRGVLDGIARLVGELPVPVIVKEVGAGLSADVVRRLLDVGVRHIDISGAGGTSWSGVELLRSDERERDDIFWDWGIPTAEAIMEARALCETAGATLIASGGIAESRDIPIALALGAHAVASARPMLTALRDGGVDGLRGLVATWRRHLRYAMFLTGSIDVAALRRVSVRDMG
jgi:isopentenyl-diphosphate delta-isomerase